MRLRRHSHTATRPCRILTKEYGSSWIFELDLTWANALRRVQHPAFSLVPVIEPPASSSATRAFHRGQRVRVQPGGEQPRPQLSGPLHPAAVDSFGQVEMGVGVQGVQFLQPSPRRVAIRSVASAASRPLASCSGLPTAAHSANRRQQVITLPQPNSSTGSSAHGVEVRVMKMIAAMQARSGTVRGAAAGMGGWGCSRGWMCCHSASGSSRSARVVIGGDHRITKLSQSGPLPHPRFRNIL